MRLGPVEHRLWPVSLRLRTHHGARIKMRHSEGDIGAKGSAELHTDVRTYGHTDTHTHTDGHDTFGAPKQADLMRIRASKAVQKRHFSSTDFKLTFSKPGRHLDLRFGSRDPKCGILRGIYVATSGRFAAGSCTYILGRAQSDYRPGCESRYGLGEEPG